MQSFHSISHSRKQRRKTVQYCGVAGRGSAGVRVSIRMHPCRRFPLNVVPGGGCSLGTCAWNKYSFDLLRIWASSSQPLRRQLSGTVPLQSLRLIRLPHSDVLQPRRPRNLRPKLPTPRLGQAAEEAPKAPLGMRWHCVSFREGPQHQCPGPATNPVFYGRSSM